MLLIRQPLFGGFAALISRDQAYSTMKPVDVPTTTALLEGLQASGNRAAWEEFDRRYRPILVAFLRRSGLHESDAEDVAQDTLTCFVRDYAAGRYDRGQGRLRAWLIAIARYRLADLRRAVGRRRERRGESAIDALPEEDDAERIWDEEERRVIFESAFRELRESSRFRERTLEAFDRVVLKREPIESVCSQLDLTQQEIYNAKNRVVERLREITRRYEALYVGG